jgi:hypothetical protein
MAVRTRLPPLTVELGFTPSVAVGLLAPPIAYLPTFVASRVAAPAQPVKVLPEAAATTTVLVTEAGTLALPATSEEV